MENVKRQVGKKEEDNERVKMARADSNLKCFLKWTTPSMSSHITPKASLKDLNTKCKESNKDTIEYFILDDLWKNFYEWSFHGVGVPILLNGNERVVQYYVPYLSAIQVYTNKSNANFGNASDESEIDGCSDESECEKFWDALSEDLGSEKDSVQSGNEQPGNLYFEYFEHVSPSMRMPFIDKINQLACSHPGLKSLKSTDLSPSTWMSIAWYPIYPIPDHGNVKKLYSTSFLTYHNISSPSQVVDTNGAKSSTDTKAKARDSNDEHISFPPFGLATYKFQSFLWINPGGEDAKLLSSLYSAADSWLKQMGVQQHDFAFFSSHYYTNN